MLLAPVVDAANPVKTCFDGSQDRREEGALAVEDTRHIAAERHHESDNDGAVEQNLNPADDGHGRNPFTTTARA